MSYGALTSLGYPYENACPAMTKEPIINAIKITQQIISVHPL